MKTLDYYQEVSEYHVINFIVAYCVGGSKEKVLSLLGVSIRWTEFFSFLCTFNRFYLVDA